MMKKNAKQAKVKHKDFKDIQIMIMSQGHDAVKKLFEQGLTTIAVLKRAEKEMPKANQLFSKWLAQVSQGAGRGKLPPKLGDERPYKAQQFDGSGLFIRLPVGLYVKAKGASLVVKFEADGMRVVAAKAVAGKRKQA